MKIRKGKYNIKPKMIMAKDVDIKKCSILLDNVVYTGNPKHKKNPGDFGLTPPSAPRPASSLCDSADIFKKEDALRYLKNGIKKGMFSVQDRNGYPKQIWSVDDRGHPLEAQLENQEIGAYHGYPVPESDPRYKEILKEWKIRNEICNN